MFGAVYWNCGTVYVSFQRARTIAFDLQITANNCAETEGGQKIWDKENLSLWYPLENWRLLQITHFSSNVKDPVKITDSDLIDDDSLGTTQLFFTPLWKSWQLLSLNKTSLKCLKTGNVIQNYSKYSFSSFSDKNTTEDQPLYQFTAWTSQSHFKITVIVMWFHAVRGKSTFPHDSREKIKRVTFLRSWRCGVCRLQPFIGPWLLLLVPLLPCKV